MLAVGDTLGACEQRLGRGSHSIPTVAIVGASYTAGVGPGVSSLSWAAVLAKTLHWNAVIYGVPGAGYVSKGDSSLGPVSHMIEAERLRGLDPALVIVQAGHDDGGVPSAVERRQVEATIEEIRAQAQHARIALLTVFTKPATTHWLEFYRTDRAIVTAARAADPSAIIMDPFTGRWKFAHFHGGLHPTASGDAQIARRVAAILRSQGIAAATRATAAPVTCQVSIGVGGGAANTRAVSRDALSREVGEQGVGDRARPLVVGEVGGGLDDGQSGARDGAGGVRADRGGRGDVLRAG
jgi:lysophospholipase L1-like esterase